MSRGFALAVVGWTTLAVGCGSSTSGTPTDVGGGIVDARQTDLSDAGPTGPDASDDVVKELTITLSASPAQVTTTAPMTLTAVASAPEPIDKIEIYEGDTLLATASASPANLGLSFVEGDDGPHAYTAKAYTATSVVTSAPVAVDVAIPPDPCGADRSRCVAQGCPPGLCLSPSHVAAGFGKWSRSRGIREAALSGTLAFDTKTGAIGPVRAANADPAAYEIVSGVGFVRVPQISGEPDVAVWVFSALTMNGVNATFTGDAAAVLAVANDAKIVASRLDLGAKGAAPGPGGFAGGSYGADGAGCAFGRGAPSGGGGAGFGTDGAQSSMAAGGLAMSCEGPYGELLSLRGGSGGGGGDDADMSAMGPFGGAGGGALQITAFGALSLDAIVNVGGGAGHTPQGDSHFGSGGGSGGAIFLESPSIAISPTTGLYANGGGGGSSSASGPCGSAAQDGQPSMMAATGSRCGAGAGGDGAAGASAATAGVAGGGGGGGLGRIVLRTLAAGPPPQVGSANLSPAMGTMACRVLRSL